MLFHAGDALFIGGDHGRLLRLDKAVEQLLDFPFSLLQLIAQRLFDGLALGEQRRPDIAEHAARKRDHFPCRLHGAKQRCERLLDLIARDRFPATDAALVEAHVIRVALAGLALRKACRHGAVAIAAQDETAQRERRVDVGAGRSDGLASQPVLRLQKSLIAHQPVMPSLAHGYVPAFRPFHHARVQEPRQNAVGRFIGDGAIAVLRKSGLAFQKARHFGLRLESPAGVAFDGLLDNGGQRLVPDQHAPISGLLLKPESYRRVERPVAIHQAPALAVDHLFCVFLALVLRDRSQQVLNEDGIGILAELDGRAFQPPTRIGNRFAQGQMRFEITRPSGYIIDDDNIRSGFPVLPEVVEHGPDAGAVDQPSGNGLVLKHLFDRITFMTRELAATGRLRLKAVTSLQLGDGRNPRIDNGSGCLMRAHIRFEL